MKLALQIVLFGGEQYMPLLAHSLKNQSYTDFHLFIRDNESPDKALDVLINHLSDAPFTYSIERGSNIGFAGGHNALYARHDADYVCLVNPDLYLMPDCLKHMLTTMDNNTLLGSVSARLMSAPELPKLSPETIKGETIDALGLLVHPNRRVTEQYQGMNWERVKTQFNHSILHVFGVSGTLPLYRTSAIGPVFFDESFHSYKEDVDLAWRLYKDGHESAVVLDAVAYHDRSTGSEGSSVTGILRNKKKQSEYVRFHSYRNHLYLLKKHEKWWPFQWHHLNIISHEMTKALFMLVRHPKLFIRVWRDILKK